MSKNHVDFAGSAFPGATQDTGSTAADAIRPILNGQPATQTTLQRPDENLRARTEIIRTELEGLKYLSQADRGMVVSLEPVSSVGTVLWNGTVAGGGGGDGKFSITAGKKLTLRPFLAPRVSTPAKIINRGLKFQTNLTVAGPINPPRAYGNANKYNIQFVNQTGAAVSVTYDPLLFRFTVNTDTTAVTGSEKTDVINAFNAAATSAGQGITATIDSGFGTDIFAEGVTFVQGDPADYMVFAGAADAELHEIADTTLTAFFNLDAGANAMEENDVLAIWYDSLIDNSFGGRAQSIADAPESPSIEDIPVGSLFLARRFPERLHNAIPVATVVGNQLLLIDGTLAPKGLATPVTGGGNELPAPVAALPPRMLQMDAAGPPHNWGDLNDNKFVGGLQTVATTGARDLIDATQRKEGMVVYCADVDRHFVLEGGLLNANWKEFGDDNRLVGGLQTVVDTTARNAIPAAKRKEGMVVYSQADDRHFVLEGGLLDANWKDFSAASRLVGGFHTVATYQLDDLDATLNALIPAAQRTTNMRVAIRRATGFGDEHTVMRYDGSDVWRPAEGSNALRVRHITPPVVACNTQVTGVSGAWVVSAYLQVTGMYMLLPNGEVARKGNGLNLFFAGQGGNVLPDRIEGGTPTFDGIAPVVIYLFVRQKHGDVEPVLRYSSNAPNISGGYPLTTTEVGYTEADYGYIGMAWLMNAQVNDATVGTLTQRARHNLIYGASDVINVGVGRSRERCITNPRSDGTLVSSHVVTWDDAAPDGTTQGVAAGLTTEIGTFPTATRVRVLVTIQVQNTNGSASDIRLRFGDEARRVNVPASTTLTTSFVAEVSNDSPARDHPIIFERLTAYPANTMQLESSSCVLLAVIENVSYIGDNTNAHGA